MLFNMQWESNLLKRTHTTHTHTSEQTGDMYQLLGISRIAHVSWILVLFGFEPQNVIPRFQAAGCNLGFAFFWENPIWVWHLSEFFGCQCCSSRATSLSCGWCLFIWLLYLAAEILKGPLSSARLQMLHKRTQRTPENSNKTCDGMLLVNLARCWYEKNTCCLTSTSVLLIWTNNMQFLGYPLIAEGKLPQKHVHENRRWVVRGLDTWLFE